MKPVDAEEQAAYFAVVVGASIERALADLLSLDATLFVWDQCLMSSFAATVPRVAATVFWCIKDALAACVEREEFVAVLYEQAKTIAVGRLQVSQPSSPKNHSERERVSRISGASRTSYRRNPTREEK